MMWDVRACRICLAHDVRLDPPDKHQLQRVYENVTGIKLASATGLPQYLCFECAALLRRFRQFRAKCRRGDATLRSIFDANEIVTQNDITSVDRVRANLTSPLTLCRLAPIECSPDREDCDVKGEDSMPFGYDLTEIKKEEEIPQFSPLPDIGADDSLDGSLKDEPLINLKLEVARETKERKGKAKKNSKKVKSSKVKKKLKESTKNSEPEDTKVSRYPRSYYEEFAVVTSLTPEQQVAEIEKRKTTANYVNSPHKCTLCFKGFIDEVAFKNHMARHDPTAGDFECDVCRRRFSSVLVLRKHIGNMHTTQYACRRCNHVSSNGSQARMHELWHRGKIYECPHCDETFPKFTTYMGHVRKKHTSQFVCELCGNTFLSEKGINQHKTLVHHSQQTEKLFGPYCAECDITFFDNDSYQRHIACTTKHSTGTSKMLSCEECEQIFDSRSALKLHAEKEHTDSEEKKRKRKTCKSSVRTKDEGYPKPCVLCSEEVGSGREYWMHFRRQHKDKAYPKEPSSYTCEVCGKGFKGYALLQYHLRKHTGEKPFACTECDKTFMLAEYLTRHRRVHTGEKRYPCAVCGKRYQTKSNLDKHQLIHTGEKKHACEMCGKTFKVPYEKRAHVEHVHLKKPWPKRDRNGRKIRPAEYETGQ